MRWRNDVTSADHRTLRVRLPSRLRSTSDGTTGRGGLPHLPGHGDRLPAEHLSRRADQMHLRLQRRLRVLAARQHDLPADDLLSRLQDHARGDLQAGAHPGDRRPQLAHHDGLPADLRAPPSDGPQSSTCPWSWSWSWPWTWTWTRTRAWTWIYEGRRSEEVRRGAAIVPAARQYLDPVPCVRLADGHTPHDDRLGGLPELPLPGVPGQRQSAGADQLLADLLHLLSVQRGLPQHPGADHQVALAEGQVLPSGRAREPEERPRLANGVLH
ncbi:uncharacterized protein [Drosophila takahashii]|uniref:uncharacterized protein isoform X4 n=1 Tax=Drosophila takahashii TaxID=29030 RepID=UPI003898FB42